MCNGGRSGITLRGNLSSRLHLDSTPCLTCGLRRLEVGWPFLAHAWRAPCLPQHVHERAFATVGAVGELHEFNQPLENHLACVGAELILLLVALHA